MAKFKIKGKKVTGTKKKDKIVWQSKSAWKKALTVNAGSGNDTIDFSKSAYKNILNGQAGNDLIKGGKKDDKINGGAGKDKLYGNAGNDTITGGKGNDIINAGKGKNTIIFAKGDGVDAVYNGKGTDTLKFTNFKNISKLIAGLKLTKSGNDLLLNYTAKDGVKLVKFFSGTSVAKLMSNDKKTIKLADLLKKSAINISGKGSINGTAYNDIIIGSTKNDTIKGGNGNDKISGGAGNDVINAGKGTNTIYLKKKEGTNIIQNGGGNDTLVFSQESSFDNFTFTNNGDDLNIRAGGTTAVLKGYNAGTSSVKTVQAGNQNLSKLIIKENAHNEEIQGSAENDLFFISKGSENKIYTGTGNDIVYLNNERWDKVYASEGDNYINIKESYDTTIYLDKMSGNNTFTTDWKQDFKLKFDVDGDSADEMIRTITLDPGDGYYKYVLGQKSGNDLVMKTINGKTATIKYFFNDFYEESYNPTVQDKSDTLFLGRFSNKRIFFSENPGYVKLTGNSGEDTLNNQQNKYIYGKADIAYTVTMNDASYNNIVIAGDKTKTINIENSLQNYMDIYGGYSKSININNAQYNYMLVSGGEIALTMNGSNNYAFVSGATTNSVLNFNGNYNYIETTYLSGTTVNINGNGNYANISSFNNETSPTITVNTTGSNEVNLYTEFPPASNNGTTFYVNSTGNDTFYQTNYDGYSSGCNYNYDFTGSEGKNKFINASHNNTMSLNGTDDAGEIKISTENTLDYVFSYYKRSNVIFLQDYNMDTLEIHGISLNNIYGPDIYIYGGESNLNTTAFADKIKINTDGDNGEFKSLNNFAQYFGLTGDSFTFGDENMGYLKNLTNDFIIKDLNDTETTYSNYTFASGRHTIIDKSGNDRMTISENNNDIRMYFNINADKTFGDELYFIKTSEFQNFMKGNEVSGYLDIKNAFNTGKIETISAPYGILYYNGLTSKADNSLIAEVAGWLTSNGKDSVADVINTGTDSQKTALYNIYESHMTDKTNYWLS